MDLFKRQTTVPTKGQFIAVWMFEGKPWSGTYQYDSEGCIEVYNENLDEWQPCEANAWAEGTIFFAE